MFSLIKFDIVFSSLESSENALLHQSQAFCTMFLLSKLRGCALKLYEAGDVKKICYNLLRLLQNNCREAHLPMHIVVFDSNV